MGFVPTDLDRMETLAAIAREGSLSDDERSEVEKHEHIDHMIALLKSKARRSLQRANGGR